MVGGWVVVGVDADGAGYRTPASKSVFSTFDSFSVAVRPQKP